MRIGVDLGGTKIEIIALEDDGSVALRKRVPAPQSAYRETLATIASLVVGAERDLGRRGAVGVAIPGALSPGTGLVKNANSTHLIGHPIDRDLSALLQRQIRVANDANCFVLSEASDGAGAGFPVVFGIIAGTGVGGGLCVAGSLVTGPHAIAGEWGHNPLPAALDNERPGPLCYCGRRGCIETWCSGPALSTQYERLSGQRRVATEIAEMAGSRKRAAVEVMENFYDRLARAIGSIVNVLDPDAIVLGGGLSRIEALYSELPPRVEKYAFHPEGVTQILRNRHGDSSGVRGAAWLWAKDEIEAGLPG